MRTRAGLAALAVALTIVLFAGSASAAPGDLDPTFAGDGIAATAPVGYAWVSDVHVQPSGRIVVISGVSGTGTVAYAFTPTGAADTAFGAGGTSTVPGIFAGRSSMFPDGRVVVNAGAEIMRLSVNGALDPSFGTGGIATLPTWFWTTDVAALARGGVVVAGTDQRTCNFKGHSCKGALARLAPNGLVVWARTLDISMAGPRVAIGPLDRILVTTHQTVYAFLGLTGLPDVTFGLYGNAAIPEAWNLGEIMPDGRGRLVVVVGSFTGDSRLARLTADGQLDATFGTNGFTEPLRNAAFPVRTLFSRFALLADGTIAVVGKACATSPCLGVGVVGRFSPNGTMDTAFGSEGLVAGPIAGLSYDSGVVGQPDGKIVVADFNRDTTAVEAARLLQ